MRLANLISAIETIAPLDYAEPWDKVGLLAGDAQRTLNGPVLFTIDLTERVLAEACAAKASAIVAYHPPIWEPLKRLTAATARERVLLRALESGIGIYSPHTALDAAPGGLTDWLCEGLSGGTENKIAGDCRSLKPHAPHSREVKIVTFVPMADVDKVRSALATAGAGIIGSSSLCSFESSGTGTFLGNDASNPAVGTSGAFERVPEMRLEMVCSARALPLALETLRQFHPYEEPAADIYPLDAKPRRSAGGGRRLHLDRPATLRQLGERLRKFLGRARVQIASVGGHEDLDRAVSTIGAVPGAGSSLLETAIAEKCEVFVTGEMKHHDVVASLQAGVNVILAGHTNTERGYLPRLASRLEAELPGLRTIVSVEDRDPLVVV